MGISQRLQQQLEEDRELAINSNSEKARSEFLIAPILAEVRRQKNREVSLFSGVEFNVDEAHGLVGVCDFLFSLSPMSLEIRAPVVSIVEAKKENITAGIPQCLAELVAAQRFNAAQERSISCLYGVVTTGEIWRFLRLEGAIAVVDNDEYYIGQVEKIMGILLSMLSNGN